MIVVFFLRLAHYSIFFYLIPQFTLQLSLACLCEYALHLTATNADMMYIHQDSGLINISYFKFDIDEATDELGANRAVPFRLTPNIVEFLSGIGIAGPLTTSAIVTARCLVQPNFKVCIIDFYSFRFLRQVRCCFNYSGIFFRNLLFQLPTILRAILRDEIIALHKKRLKDERMQMEVNSDGNPESPTNDEIKVNMDSIIIFVNKAVNSIMARLSSISYFDSVENNKMCTLVQAARNPDNLCRMDPAWHPWV